MAKASLYYYGVGRRKEASVQVKLRSGTGTMTVNGAAGQDYFGRVTLVELIQQPLAIIGRAKEFDIELRARGGGKAGQADAARLAVAKALQEMDKELRPTLKKAGYLKRDARIKERKKPGLKRARKAPQFTKR
ncbi:30S ribosomal protein S9 [Candidatus Microgenomates bacterium]|nr:30S ribosomal protein S9 [Candidatus Microgenomates bacterium]